MRVLGIDFTSAPTARKPIVRAGGWLEEGGLVVDGLDRATSIGEFAQWLGEPGPWLAAIDFPLGLPRAALAGWRWPTAWEAYVRRAGKLSREAFVGKIDAFRAARPPGKKHPRRAADVAAGAVSPLMTVGVPVGRMFHAGAPAVAASPASVVPCRLRADSRGVVEAYPALVARHLWGRRPYKGESGADAQRRGVRAEATAALQREAWRAGPYGMAVRLTRDVAAAAEGDPRGDVLDAVFACVQAGWLAAHRDRLEALAGCDPVEGWIADPRVLPAASGRRG